MSRPMKKKKKERTWAEAITEALRRNEKTKIMGLREIHDAIYMHKLKDIGMTKTDEKNLRTMLAQHTSTPTAAANCFFYRVKDRPGYYGLKDEAMMPNKAQSIDSTDSNELTGALKRKIKEQDSPVSNVKKKLTTKTSANIVRRSNSFAGNALRKARLLTHRRTSSPNVMSSFTNLRNRQHQQHFPSRSSSLLQKPLSSANTHSRKMQLDLETPTSVLTNTRLKSIINSATFSMLPPSYQYQLIQLLPAVDRKPDANQVPRMSRMALNNEFFSQAIQDWATQLSEGEFTRETQTRIMQEISRERSKINPWKEKFFEEYYGQRKELKRTRSRSHDMGNNLADLSFEAQLEKFKHLSESLNTVTAEKKRRDSPEIIVVSASESDQDPDYAGTGHTNTQHTEKDSTKSINRRKIRKPFKRTIYNSSIAYPTNTAMIHRRGAVNTSNIFSRFASNDLSEFQVRDETYRSDSEASETELSDSNSFHQHDETDDDGESSDDMMNVGDDDLLNVDGENSDSDDSDRPIAELIAKPSNIKIMAKRKSQDQSDGSEKSSTVMDDANKPHNEADEKPSISMKSPHRDISGSRNAHGSILGEKAVTAPTSEKSHLPVSAPAHARNVVKSESIGSLFGHALPSPANPSYGDSIVPRISATSALLSSAVPPTTVCTAATPARMMNDKSTLQKQPGKPTPAKHGTLDKLKPMSQNLSANSAFHPLSSKSKETVIKTEQSNSGGTPLVAVPPFHDKPASGLLKAGQTSGHPLSSQFRTPVANSNSAAGIRAFHQSATVGKPGAPTPPIGVKRPLASLTSSPMKRTKTLAEIKAQMKAKRLAVATASPGISARKGLTPPTPVNQRQPVKLAQPIFRPTTVPTTNTTTTVKPSECPTPVNVKSENNTTSNSKNATANQTAVPDEPVKDECAKVSLAQAQNKIESDTVKKEVDNRNESQHNSKEKIILKIKGGVVENCVPSDGKVEKVTKSSDSDEDEIIRKKRRLSQVIMSSGESSDDLDRLQNLTRNIEKVNDNYSMLTQLALPSSFSTKSNSDGVSLLKRTPKSPVFGETPYNVTPAASLTCKSEVATKERTDVKIQPFMSDRPAIGFQDIPSCSALSSATDPTFVSPATAIAPSSESQKYRSTSKDLTVTDVDSKKVALAAVLMKTNGDKIFEITSNSGKSLVKMQQLARSSRTHSDESDLLDSDTEDDSTASTVSSTEEDKLNSLQRIGRSMLRKRDPATGRVERSLKPNVVEVNGGDLETCKKKQSDSSDCDDSCSSSSSDDKQVLITECICACKRLVLCKGCGAYTHEECLSAAKLCSLCVL